MKNKIRKFLPIIIVLITIIFGISTATILYKKSDKNNNVTNKNVINQEDVNLIISINPKIMLRINNNEVLAVYQLNEDAVIFTNDDLQGLEIENAVKKIIEIATEHSYINEDTEVRISTYKADNSDYVKVVYDAVETNFLNNGVHIKPYELTKDEVENIEELLNNYVEKKVESVVENSIKEETQEKNKTNSNTNNKINSKNNNSNDKNNTNTNSATKNNTNTNSNTNSSTNQNFNNNSSNNTNSSNQGAVNEQPTKLDINNVYGSYKADYFVKMDWLGELGYETPKAYYQAMVERCNNGTLTEIYPWLNDDSNLRFSNVKAACDFIKDLNNRTYYNTYLKVTHPIYISKEGGYMETYDYLFDADRNLNYINNKGGAGAGPNICNIKITSDTNYYYIEYCTNTSRPNRCKAGKDLVFTCENEFATDEYTGKKIYSFKKS